MGRELQKKKKRSGRQPVRRKKPSKKQVLSNPVIADNWNSRDTMSRNYRRLGLVSKLNSRTGGSENHKRALMMRRRNLDGEEFTGFDDTEDMKDDDPLRIVPTPVALTHQAMSEVKIARDDTGNAKIVGRDNPKISNPLNDSLNDVAPDEDEKEISIWGSLGYVGSAVGPSRGVVSQLEALAEAGERKAPRKQSTREVEWIERLVNKHGDDYRAMSRDVKLNPMQQSEGDIKRRMKKWQQENITG